MSHGASPCPVTVRGRALAVTVVGALPMNDSDDGAYYEAQ